MSNITCFCSGFVLF